MGIFCQIFIQNSQQSFKPGDTVAGVIRYCLDEPTNFSEITISLKGHGKVVLKKGGKNRATHSKTEDYVDVDYVNLKEETTIPVGSYEIPFTFLLPKDVPASLDIVTHASSYRVTCKIEYYVRIKFEKPEFFSLAKRFKKELIVLPTMTPKLPMEPSTYTKTGNVFRFCLCNSTIVDIKATVKSCVIKPEGIIEVEVEINNDSHVDLNYIECKLKRTYRFNARNKVKKSKILFDSRREEVPRGASRTIVVELHVPKDEVSLEHAKIVSREYFVVVTAGVPCPHFNIDLKIPVQIGEFNETSTAEKAPSAPPAEILPPTDEPPSYWEVMGEDEDK